MSSDAEFEKVFSAFESRRGNREIFHEEAEIISDWLNHAVISEHMKELVLRGMLTIDVTDGEVVFCNTAEGQARGEALSKTAEGKALVAKLHANKDKIAPKEEWPPSKSLAARILKLLYFWNHEMDSPTSELIGDILGCGQAAAGMAMKSLKEHGMIEQG